MIHFIGIHGPKRVGKDLFAANLATEIQKADGQSVLIDRLADPLYIWAKEVTGWPVHRLMGHEKDTPFTAETALNKSLIGRTPRSVLLDLGIFMRQNYGMKFLSECQIMRAKTHTCLRGDGDLWILVPDVRTEEEANYMEKIFDLTRDGCAYEGGLTEHAIGGIGVIPIHLKTCTDASKACDFTLIAKTLLSAQSNLPV